MKASAIVTGGSGGLGAAVVEELLPRRCEQCDLPAYVVRTEMAKYEVCASMLRRMN